MSKTSLQITEDMEALDQLLADEGLDFDDPAVQEIICQWAEENTEAFDTKMDNAGALIQEWLGRAELRKNEAKRMSSLATVDENNAKRLKEHLKFIFDRRGIKKLETNRFRLSVAKNGGLQPLEINCEPEELPTEFQKTLIVCNNEAIREALVAGQTVPGCILKERGTSFRVK